MCTFFFVSRFLSSFFKQNLVSPEQQFSVKLFRMKFIKIIRRPEHVADAINNNVILSHIKFSTWLVILGSDEPAKDIMVWNIASVDK